MRENSSSFFANTACKYYPCHKKIEEINCLFCYCPLYFLDSCPGTFTWIERKETRIKNCTDCIFPHKAENYEEVIRCLRNAIYETDIRGREERGQKTEDDP